MKIPIKSFYFDRFLYLFWPGIGHEKELFLNVPPAGEHSDADKEQEYLVKKSFFFQNHAHLTDIQNQHAKIELIFLNIF